MPIESAMARRRAGDPDGHLRAEPVLGRVFRWPKGNPQYDVGHLERVSAMQAAAAAHARAFSWRQRLRRGGRARLHLPGAGSRRKSCQIPCQRRADSRHNAPPSHKQVIMKTILLCAGVTHHTASLEVRQCLSQPAETLANFLAEFQPGPLQELAVLSTCNRLELYACASAESWRR